jgi:hypothetical protein
MIMGMIIVLFFGIRTVSCQEISDRTSASLPAYRTHIAQLKEAMGRELERFKEKSFGADIATHHMLRLIDTELELTDSLIDGKNGLPIVRLREKKNKLIAQTAPSVLCVYDMLLNYAVAESMYGCKMRDHINKQKTMWTVLYADPRHHFLNCMADIFDNYYRLIKQYTESIA